MSTTFAYDVTALFYPKRPQGFQLCGYDTGSSGIAWTPAMWKANPGAVHVDQSQDTAILELWAASERHFDEVAHHLVSDVLDVESGAVPVGSPLVAAWAKGAQAAFAAGTRPGQRRPALYQSASNVTANVNALLAGGVDSGVGLWIAKWDGRTAADIAALEAAAGPFPVIGYQYADEGDFDADVFSTDWLDTVSGDGWVFGPVRRAKFEAGSSGDLGVSFYSPGTPQKLGVGDYEIAASLGDELGDQLEGFPAYIPKAKSSKQSYAGQFPAGLHGQKVTVGVRAIATNGSHAGPWVTAQLSAGS